MNKAERELLLRSFDDDLTDSESSSVDKLLRSDQDAAKHFANEEAFRALVGSTEVLSFENGFSGRVLAKTHPVPTSMRRVNLKRPWLFAAAACITILFVVGTLWAVQNLYSDTVTRQASFASTEVVSLPDGSTVVLNAGSSITFPRSFAGNRSVKLSGEAFFEVVENDAPFVVQTVDADLSVLGTTFNVRAWSDLEQRTMVHLQSGSLRVDDRDNRSVLMVPGDRVAVYRTSGLAVRVPGSAPSPTSVDWRDGIVAFDGERFDFAMAELERRYDVRIQFTDVELASRKVTYLPGSSKSVEAVLTTICSIFGYEYRQTSDGFNIESP